MLLTCRCPWVKLLQFPTRVWPVRVGRPPASAGKLQRNKRREDETRLSAERISASLSARPGSFADQAKGIRSLFLSTYPAAVSSSPIRHLQGPQADNWPTRGQAAINTATAVMAPSRSQRLIPSRDGRKEKQQPESTSQAVEPLADPPPQGLKIVAEGVNPVVE